MKKALKKKLEKILNMFPSNKIIFGIITAVILAVLLYVVILLLLSK